MRFDIVTIFPDYFKVLDISLLGRAQNRGIVDVQLHDLRDWADDRHRGVDDTPFGGGAGMVMRPDVWGRALNDLHRDGQLLMMPTPAGLPLTQQQVTEIAASGRDVLIGCGRYEGIDSRVFEKYDVVEYSIGDYVVNGGEVAALVLLEAVSRLLEGTVGNPESLVEESHSQAGLLEYPAYTRPRSWAGMDVPEVLLSGDHGAIGRWRRDRALERTAQRRPDMVWRLQSESLDSRDRELLAYSGYVIAPRQARCRFRLAISSDANAVSQLAGRLFPDACPSWLSPEAITAFIDTELSAPAFESMLSEPQRYRVLLAEVCVHDAWELVGYTLIITYGSEGSPPVVEVGQDYGQGAAYLSKCYVDGAWRASGIAGALLESAVADLLVVEPQTRSLVLGTNETNRRALRFYRNHGFRKSGKRTFDVGGVENRDLVLSRDLTGLNSNPIGI
ncbi:MAG: tRNA (guanosine(37)-N1)-methyltransferase TrmD [Varibaculum sp.]|nr:tRNA (guanosine(37)-N1)-methyltransferase TrmD [Varibaculum sp.]